MRLIIVILLAISPFFILAQGTCNDPGRSAQTAQSVCGTLVFHQKDLVNCPGQSIPNPTAGCGNIVNSDNAAWYKFHCYQTGSLGFLLTPLGAGDDYDWEIMDVTGHNPNDVFIAELRVSLNLSGVTGPTGCTATGSLNIHCAGGPPGSQYNAMPTLTAGHDYLLMVNNYSHSGLGYDLTFSGSAVLTSNVPPEITDVSILGCDASKIKITFSEDILCSSISPLAGTEFTITSGTHTIAGIVSDCNIGANGIPSLTLNLQTALTAGNYQLNVADGSDGNTLKNICESLMLPVSKPFTVASLAPVEIDTITFTGCAPNMLRVKLTKPVWCSSISPSAGEITFLPATPPITIVAVQSTCTASLYTDELQLYLQNRLPYGNYQLLINNGGDNNTFIDTCGNPLAPAIVPFVINQTTVAPVIQSVGFNECHPDKVVINFDKPVLCSTISSAAEFSISPGVWPINTVTYNCTNVGAYTYTSQIILNLQNALPAGNFSVAIGNGNDNNSLADTCYAFVNAGYNKSFVTTKAPAPKYDSLQFDKCSPSQIKIFYSNAIDCSSVYVAPVEFYITGPAPVNMMSVSGPNGQCTTSNVLILNLAQPISAFGNYVLHNKWGPDGNSVRDTCGAAQDTTETIAFTVLGKPSPAFTSSVKFGCKMDTVILSHPGGNAVNSWQWTFEDGSTATGQTVTKTFPVSTVSTRVYLKVDNGFCNDTTSALITLDNAFKAAFLMNPKDTGCINTPITLTNTSTGKNLQYLWLFGDNSQFAGITPPPHVYNSSNIYNIKLAVTDVYGCTDTAATFVNITPSASIDFTGLPLQTCTDKTISLVRSNISPYMYTYTWDNGDGVTVIHQTHVQFRYPKEGVYTITLAGTDRYCGIASVSKTINVFAVPKINLGNDTVLCPAVQLPIGVPFTNGYDYLWSNGATTPQILTDIFTSDYSLLVNNNGCQATDAISVKVLPACLIRVPNAFTPNNDGSNDKLKAINADLAKEFTLRVYNRFGQLLFVTNDPLQGWDGNFKSKGADAGSYVWQLSYVDPWSLKKVFVSGTSILIR